MEAGFPVVLDITEEEFKWTGFALLLIDAVRLKFYSSSPSILSESDV